VAPPECPARLQTASVLPPAPTISSSRTRVDREPEITAIRATTPSDDDSASSDNDSDHTNESQDHSEDRSANSGSDTDGIDAQSPETSAAPFSLDHLLDLSGSTVSLLQTLLLFPIIVF